MRLSRACVWLLLLLGCDRPRDAFSPAENSGSPSDKPTQSAVTPSRGLLSGLEPGTAPDTAKPEVACRVRFVDVHEQAGVQFVYDSGASSAKLMPESTSGGGGWLDYDADGHWDLYLPQGGSLSTTDRTNQPRDQLWRNRHDGTFANVTVHARLVDLQFSHGVAIGDYDNDGFDDIYVTNVGPDVLYRNLGDGTFEDVTHESGIQSPHWGSSAAWGDLDRDGLLDLYVCNYVDYDPRKPIACLDEQGQPATCNPTMVEGVPNACYFNDGDGRFTNRADARGLNGPDSKSLGVVIADLNGDGLPDVYVANDTCANHLFINQGGGRFVESALAMGAALSGLGQAQASMGIGFGDYDRDGRPDLYVTHFTTDSNTLYRNLGPAGFSDTTREVDLHLPTLKYLGFGTVMCDLDADGWQDLFVANGHIEDFRRRTGALWYMPPQLFRFDGRRWRECSAHGGAYFQHDWLGRAVATADYDRDGDPDLLVIHQNDQAALLRNDSERGHWLQMAFTGVESNRRGIGVKVTVTQGELTLVQELAGGTSYCSSHEPVLYFGLGDKARPCHVLAEWPSGRRQELPETAVDQRLVLLESDAEKP